jgi:tRNA threonylcarbamoyl adenosine modification protein YeaZ
MTTPVQKFLAWDTSSVAGVISAFEVKGNELRRVVGWSLSLDTSRHSERLLWSIHSVLEGAGWKLQDLSGIAVGVGPGSFTGIRIGVTTARILARTLGIPLIPLSSLALLARGAVRSLEVLPKAGPTLLIACTDATKGEWFTLMGPVKNVRDCIAMAESDLPGIWGQHVVETVFPPEVLFQEISAKLEKNPELKWMAVGQSVLRYPDDWKSLPAKSRIELTLSDLHRIEEESLVRVAFEAIQQGLFRDPQTIRPRYLRASEAEVKLKKGLLKPSPVHPRGGIS